VWYVLDEEGLDGDEEVRVDGEYTQVRKRSVFSSKCNLEQCDRKIDSRPT